MNNGDVVRWGSSMACPDVIYSDGEVHRFDDITADSVLSADAFSADFFNSLSDVSAMELATSVLSISSAQMGNQGGQEGGAWDNSEEDEDDDEDDDDDRKDDEEDEESGDDAEAEDDGTEL